MSPWDISTLKSQGYRTGSIIRVHMHNFINYDDAEVFPGPHLNVVLGPNGTGKSALTHCICLACGGSPKSIGRSDDMTTFVKNGKEGEITFCEVDILKHDSVVTVRRIINSETQGSKWMVDGKSSTQKEVKKMMAALNIDVDNLCSFMPQDRVGTFTRQSAREILQRTLECIKTTGEKSLREQQLELSAEQLSSRDRELMVDSQQDLVNKIRVELSTMQSEVDRIQQRAAMEEKLKMFEVQIAVVDIKNANAAKASRQEKVDDAVRNLATASEKLQPLEHRVRELQKKHSAYERTVRASTDKKIRADDALESARSNLNERDLKVETEKTAVDALARNMAGLENELANADRVIAKVEEEYQVAHARLPELKERMSKLSEELTDATRHQHAAHQRVDELQFALRAPSDAIESAEHELNSLKDFRQVFCSKLTGRDRDVLRAKEWLENNRGLLRGECYGPVGMEIQVKDDVGAHILEKCVPRSKLLSFVVETEEDEQLLNRELRDRQRLSINIVTIAHKDNFRSPYGDDFMLKGRQWGLQGHIGDLYVMPDLVRLLFNNFNRLHCGLWAVCPPASISPETMRSLCPPHQSFFRLYVVDKDPSGHIREIVELRGSTSRYDRDGTPSTVIQPVNPARLISSGTGGEVEDKRKTLQHEIETARNRVKDINVEISVAKRETHELGNAVTRLRSGLSECKAAMSVPENIRRKLESEKRKRAAVVRRLEGGAEREKRLAVDRLGCAVDSFLDAVGDLHREANACIDATIAKVHASWSGREIKVELNEALATLEDAKKDLQELQATVRQLERERDQANRENAAAEDRFNKLQEELGGATVVDRLFKKFTAEIEGGNALTKIDLVRHMNELKGQLEATVDNPQLIQRYKDTTERLKVEDLKLLELTREFNVAKDTLASRVEDWEVAVDSIAAKLSKSFEEYMRELQYSGNIELVKCGSLNDYEMQMRVSFRDTMALQKLSGQSHSGGERAVSTVMYLMALQRLTSSPFRVVDEINQGMDVRNERLVFDRIVRSCCTSPSSGGGLEDLSSTSSRRTATPTVQYFLISPKLLEGLKAMDNPDVTVLLVWNGPGVLSKWQLPTVTAALRKRKAELMAASNTTANGSVNSKRTKQR